jgi:hypothetical protein
MVQFTNKSEVSITIFGRAVKPGETIAVEKRGAKPAMQPAALQSATQSNAAFRLPSVPPGIAPNFIVQDGPDGNPDPLIADVHRAMTAAHDAASRMHKAAGGLSAEPHVDGTQATPASQECDRQNRQAAFRQALCDSPKSLRRDISAYAFHQRPRLLPT